MDENPNPKSNTNLDDSGKNEECLLGYSSQYKTNIYKDEEEEPKEISNDNVRNKLNNKTLSMDSTSISISQEHNNISEINLKRKSDFSKDDSFYNNNYNKEHFEFYNKQRKMSSPLFDYLKGSDKYLLRTHKKTIDIKSSNNYIKKDDYFFGGNKNPINNDNNNSNNSNNLNMNYLYQNNKEKKLNQENKNTEKNYMKNTSYNYNNINNINNYIQIPNNNPNIINNINNNVNYINNNILFMNNNYPRQIFNINYINDFPNNQRINTNNILNKRKMSYNIENGFIGNYFNNILNLNNPPQNLNETNFTIQQNQQKLNPIFFSYNEEQSNLSGNNNKINNKKNSNNNKNKKKPFDKRKGDWKCPNCNNLNFSFRVVCNRCQIQKPNNISEDED